MFYIITIFFFCLASSGVLKASTIQYIRSFDLGGDGLRTAVLSYDASLNTMNFVEPQVQLGACPPNIEISDWIRDRMRLILYKNLDDEVRAGYYFGFSLASLDRLASKLPQTADIAQLFKLPTERVCATDDGAAHLLASLQMLKNTHSEHLSGPIWNFAIGTGVGFGFTNSVGRVCRLSEAFIFFGSAPWSAKEPITGYEVWASCGSKLGFDTIVVQHSGIVDELVFSEFAARWKAFLDSCFLRCLQRQLQPPRAIVFTGGHIDLYRERLAQTLSHFGCKIPMYAGQKYSGLLGAAWNVVEKAHTTNALVDTAQKPEDFEKFCTLISDGHDVNQCDSGGLTPLRAACLSGNIQAVQVLLNHGVELDAYDFLGRTPLYIAVQLNNFSIAEALLAQGAYVNQTDCWHKTPLLWARRNQNQMMIELLKRHGATL